MSIVPGQREGCCYELAILKEGSMSITSAISQGPLYIRIWRDRVCVRNVKNGHEFDDEAVLAISNDSIVRGKKRRVVEAVGAEARTTPYDLVYPFQHPRVVLSEIAAGEKLLMYAYRQVHGRWFEFAAPIAIVHCLIDIDGGISPIEERALSWLAEAAGARKVHYWSGRILTDQEILSDQYVHELSDRPF